MILVIKQEIAQELIEDALIRVEGAKTNIWQIGLIAPNRRSRRLSSILLQRLIASVESTYSVGPHFTILSSKFSISALSSLKVDYCTIVVLRVILEDTSVEVEIFQIEYVLIIVAYFLKLLKQGRVMRLVKIYWEWRYLCLLLLW